MKKRDRGLLCTVCLLALLGTACAGRPAEKAADEWLALQPEGTLRLDYAQQFTVQNYAAGYRLLTIAGDTQYLVVPEGVQAPAGVPAAVTVLQQPLDDIYLVATSAMDLFRSLDGIGSVRLSGTDTAGWYIPEASAALESGAMLYAGKYNAPDYELILENQCDLAVESTMIYHTPEVKEQLEALGIPVLVERSSYEGSPLGRMEWIKLYGVLLGKEALAQSVFEQQVAALAPILQQENTGKTVAFFYITGNGSANVRKSGDYVAEMIRMAGGRYIFDGLTDNGNALATMNLQMETFYDRAREADVLIYNSTIDGELETLDQLFAKSGLLRDFKAVQTGDVWCAKSNLFQESMGLGDMIQDIHEILTEADPQDLRYLYRLS